MTMQRTLRLFKLPDTPEIPGFRKLVIDDVPKAHKLLHEVLEFHAKRLIWYFVGIKNHIFTILQYLTKFDLVPVFTEEEFRHWFIPQPGIVDTYVVQDVNNEITGKYDLFNNYVGLIYSIFCFDIFINRRYG